MAARASTTMILPVVQLAALAAPGAALACSPVPMSLLERLAGATSVFVGRLEGTLALLRGIVAGGRGRVPTPRVPNGEAAVHRALEVLIPAYGADAIARLRPIAASEIEGKAEGEPGWRVTAGALVVEVGKWSAAVAVKPVAAVP